MVERRSALVLVGYTEPARRLLRHAGEHARGCGLDLVLLSVMPSREYQARDLSRLQIPHLDLPYTVEAAQDEGARHARRLAREVLGDLDVDYEIESRVGREASLVLDVAAEHGCSELFLVGHRNGPWEQTTFDRVMEEVIDRFDGPVTVVMGEELGTDE
ncbi:MAG: universal stress protein [Haloarculaceae archaeon]